MPIPSPRGGKSPESKSEFISRCASDSVMNKEFPDEKQRLAVCYRQWKEAKATASVILTSEKDEILYKEEQK